MYNKTLELDSPYQNVIQTKAKIQGSQEELLWITLPSGPAAMLGSSIWMDCVQKVNFWLKCFHGKAGTEQAKSLLKEQILELWQKVLTKQARTGAENIQSRNTEGIVYRNVLCSSIYLVLALCICLRRCLLLNFSLVCVLESMELEGQGFCNCLLTKVSEHLQGPEPAYWSQNKMQSLLLFQRSLSGGLRPRNAHCSVKKVSTESVKAT